jgi:hypothetical protein
MNRRVHVFIAITMLAAAPLAAQPRQTARVTPQQRDQRYPIATMERVLEGAVTHGARVTRDRLLSIVPADTLLSDSARVRGYRLDGYGLFFDVSVPMLEWSLTWSFRTLDQNNLGLESALTAMRALVAKSGDANFEQALKRIELQVAPVSLNADPVPDFPGALTVTGSALTTPADTLPAPGTAAPGTAAPVTTAPGIDPPGTAAGTLAPDPAAAATVAPGSSDPVADAILDDPVAAFRAEIRDALMNAMLDYGAALRLAPADLLTIAARGGDDRSMLGPLNDEAQTIMITVRGSDLSAYLSGQISRDEARQRMTVRVD